MLHAAAMLVGLFIVAVMLTAPGPGSSGVLAAAMMSFVALLFSVRFGGVTPAFARAARMSRIAMRSASRIVGGALKTIRAAAAADITLRPALIRIRAAQASASGQVNLADAIGVSPGSIVVETDDEGLLVHVIDEDSSETRELGRIEKRMSRVSSDGARE